MVNVCSSTRAVCVDRRLMLRDGGREDGTESGRHKRARHGRGWGCRWACRWARLPVRIGLDLRHEEAEALDGVVAAEISSSLVQKPGPRVLHSPALLWSLLQPCLGMDDWRWQWLVADVAGVVPVVICCCCCLDSSIYSFAVDIAPALENLQTSSSIERTIEASLKGLPMKA